MKEFLVLAIRIAVVLVALEPRLLPVSERLACSAGNAPQTNDG